MAVVEHPCTGRALRRWRARSPSWGWLVLMGPARDGREARPFRVWPRPDQRLAASALLGEVLPGGDPLPRLRHRVGVSLSVGGSSIPSCRWHRGRGRRHQCAAGSVTFFGLGEMLAFLVVLVMALAYVWRKKAIGWGYAPAPKKAKATHSWPSEFYTTASRGRGQLGPQELALPVPVRHRLLRHGVHGVVRGPKYDIARFGAEFPRFSPRQADLLIIVGTISEKMGPVLRRIYEQMAEPKWVVAFGVCASTGGFYQNYSTMPGCRPGRPGRRLHSRLPAAPRAGARRPDAAAGQDPGRGRRLGAEARAAARHDSAAWPSKAKKAQGGAR